MSAKARKMLLICAVGMVQEMVGVYEDESGGIVPVEALPADAVSTSLMTMLANNGGMVYHGGFLAEVSVRRESGVLDRRFQALYMPDQAKPDMCMLIPMPDKDDLTFMSAAEFLAEWLSHRLADWEPGLYKEIELLYRAVEVELADGPWRAAFRNPVPIPAVGSFDDVNNLPRDVVIQAWQVYMPDDSVFYISDEGITLDPPESVEAFARQMEEAEGEAEVAGGESGPPRGYVN